MKNVKFKKQSGIALDDFLFWLAMSTIVLSICSIIYIEAKQQEAMESLRSKGYSLVRDFGYSDKSIPNSDLLSKCVEEEYILIDNMYEQVESLKDAEGIMCRLKENK